MAMPHDVWDTLNIDREAQDRLEESERPHRLRTEALRQHRLQSESVERNREQLRQNESNTKSGV